MKKRNFTQGHTQLHGVCSSDRRTYFWRSIFNSRQPTVVKVNRKKSYSVTAAM